jgi:glycosyltransferase involved in cell wall biosynthesis
VKLVVQIPAFNEEGSLRSAIEDVQNHSGKGKWGSLQILVVNDGSTDDTVKEARNAGVTEIVDLQSHQGLGVAFKEGLRRALALGGNILVNTDADLQYRAAEIPKLVDPIRKGEADMVIGCRDFRKIKGYPKHKRFTQTAGNLLISILYRKKIADATSGFRAFSRETAEILVSSLGNRYTYTIESLCLLLRREKRVLFVPISIQHNPERRSRLITSRLSYVRNYVWTALKFAGKQMSSL